GRVLERARRTDHDDQLRHRLSRRPEGLRRRERRRTGELPARRRRRVARRAARVVLVVLGFGVQGGHRLHGDHPGAAVALADDTRRRRRRMSTPAVETRAVRSPRAIPMRTITLAAFVALLAVAPLVLPDFHVTLLDYIGLYALVALG